MASQSSFLVVTYPEFKQADLDAIEQFRASYDSEKKRIIGAHFTLVFPVAGISEHEFVEAVTRKTNLFHPIAFTVRKATVHKDEFGDGYYCFLVPNKGTEAIKLLHDKLYEDELSTYLRKDIAYVPHITIGHANDEASAVIIANAWNDQAGIVNGGINAIEVCRFENARVTTIKRVAI